MKTFLNAFLSFLILLSCCIEAQELNLIRTIKNDSGDVKGIDGPEEILMTNDGKFIYVAGANDHSIVWFELLSDENVVYRGRVVNDPAGLNNIYDVADIALSKTEKYLYSIGGDCLSWYLRDSVTGNLTLSGNISYEIDGIEGFQYPYEIVMGPNKETMYIQGNDSNIVLFTIDENTGSPEYQCNTIYRGVNKTGSMVIPDFVVSKNGLHAYAISYKDSSLAQYDRDSSTGMLSLRKTYEWADFENDAFIYPVNIILSADDKYLYITPELGYIITCLKVEQTTGDLSYQNAYEWDGILENHFDPVDVKISAYNNYLFTCGEGGFSVYTIDTLNGELKLAANYREQDGRYLHFVGSSFTFSKNIKYFYVGDWDGEIKIFKFISDDTQNRSIAAINHTISSESSVNLFTLHGRFVKSQSYRKHAAVMFINDKSNLHIGSTKMRIK